MRQKSQIANLTSIVAVGLGGEIGVENRLPWRLKSDLRFFKQTTLGNVVILGRKTFESIGTCLPKRENIVLSHRAALFQSHPGCHQAHSVAETLFCREKFPKMDAFVIGGGVTYTEFAPFVDRYLLTIVKARFPEADAFFDEQIIGDADNWDRREIAVERLTAADADDHEFSVVELLHRRPDEIAAARDALVKNYKEKNHLLKRRALKRQLSRGVKLDQISLLT